VSKAGAVEFIVSRALRGPAGAYVCLTNVHTTVESRRLPDLRAAARGATLSVPDGMPLVWTLRRRGHGTAEKVTGIELVPMVARAGRSNGLRHFFFGGRPGVAEGAARRLRRLVPGVDVVGALAPRFAGVEALATPELDRELEQARPHVLWVGLGAPKQELWMARAAGVLEVPVMVGIGAAFDYLAGAKPAAPSFLRHVGLEWAWRLGTDPRRLWRRYLSTNTEFLWLVARERLLGAPRGYATEGAAEDRRGR
jgi:N-acetylglucosaminyldiphosphoundecaprenol N-acetyl-beta-D-mannosaminyltransferase